MTEDKLVTLSSLKEFKRLIETKLPDMVEAVFESDDEPSEDTEEYGIEILKSPSVLDLETEGSLNVKVLFAPKVVGWDSRYKDFSSELTINPELLKIAQKDYNVSPFIVFRITYPADNYGYYEISLISSSDNRISDWYSSSDTLINENQVIQDYCFNLNDVSSEEWESVTLDIEYHPGE